MEILIAITALVVIFFSLVISAMRRYKRCPSDRLLVIYGKTGKDTSGESRSAKCIHGGAAFVWPLIQDYMYLDLTPIAIDVNLRSALSLQNIRINVPSNFTVGISTEENVMLNAAVRLLGLKQDQVKDTAENIIIGQLRAVIATMKIEEINQDREKFLENVREAVGNELRKIGLYLINVNIKDIVDESGYIEALGKEAAARAINEARVNVAQKIATVRSVKHAPNKNNVFKSPMQIPKLLKVRTLQRLLSPTVNQIVVNVKLKLKNVRLPLNVSKKQRRRRNLTSLSKLLRLNVPSVIKLLKPLIQLFRRE